MSSGGSSGGDNYDAAYNARMATIAEAQQDMADTYFDFWQSDYRGFEEAQIAANLDLIPSDTALSLAQNKSAMSLLGTQTDLAQAQNKAALSLVPSSTDLALAQNKYGLSSIESKEPVMQEFYNQSLTGVDVNDRVSKAAADASQAFKNTTEQSAREVARYGLSPSRLLSKVNSNSIEQAKSVGSAKTRARTAAEDENYKRLTTAMGY